MLVMFTAPLASCSNLFCLIRTPLPVQGAYDPNRVVQPRFFGLLDPLPDEIPEIKPIEKPLITVSLGTVSVIAPTETATNLKLKYDSQRLKDAAQAQLASSVMAFHRFSIPEKAETARLLMNVAVTNIQWQSFGVESNGTLRTFSGIDWDVQKSIRGAWINCDVQVTFIDRTQNATIASQLGRGIMSNRNESFKSNVKFEGLMPVEGGATITGSALDAQAIVDAIRYGVRFAVWKSLPDIESACYAPSVGKT